MLKKVFGFIVAIVWAGIAWMALTHAAAGREGGHGDLELWWTVIAALLLIAAGGAVIGTVVHMREGRREVDG